MQTYPYYRHNGTFQPSAGERRSVLSSKKGGYATLGPLFCPLNNVIDMSFASLKHFIFGKPIPSSQEENERLSIPIALAVFASDALSSTAYATEEILLALVTTTYALQANLLSLPIAVAIALLMAIVVISYRQVIFAFPQGGGTYEVSKEQLGPIAAQIAGAALLIDYVLTVAVSVSAGVAAMTSSGLPFLTYESRLPIAIFLILMMTLINLRGTKESGKALAFPAYFFILSMAALIGTGIYKIVTGQVPPAEAIALQTNENGSIWTMALMLAALKGFSHGCAALTGIEAISDGVKAFKEPSAANANRTLVIMGCILGTIFISMTVLAYAFHVQPIDHRTVISLIAGHAFGEGSGLFLAFQAATTIILVLAANTSFSGFPHLANILANDGYLPRQLMSLGDRLVFSNGIVILGLLSILLVWLYQADTHALIPLYAVGVFLSFTLAQAGMVLYHRHHQHPGWQQGLFINGLGALTTGVVTVILTIEKFTAGAWIVLVAIPILISLFRSVAKHYKDMGKQLALPQNQQYCPVAFEHTVLVLVSSLNRGTIPALEYAKSIGHHVEAVHIELNAASTERLRQNWDDWGCGIPLTILKSPYRSLTGPLLDYIDEVEGRYEHDIVTVIIPEFVTKQWWHNLLHNQTSLLIKAMLRFRKGKVVTSIRYHLNV